MVESSVEGSSVQCWRGHDIMASVHPLREVVKLASVASVTTPTPDLEGPSRRFPCSISSSANSIGHTVVFCFDAALSGVLLSPPATRGCATPPELTGGRGGQLPVEVCDSPRQKHGISTLREPSNTTQASRGPHVKVPQSLTSLVFKVL